MLLSRQIPLEIQQEIERRHGSSREEVRRHPALLVVIRRVLVAEIVHKELASGLEGSGDLGHECLVVLHVFKHLVVVSSPVSIS